jgi:hypothetical protein
LTGEAVLASHLPVGGTSLSIQRVSLDPMDGASANLGAAPCVILKADPRELHVAVPVAPEEALWIGVMLPTGAEFVSATADGSPLQMQMKVGDSDGAQFLRSFPFGAGNCATTTEVAVRDSSGESKIRIELSSVEAFNRRFRLAWRPDPAPTTYEGWRLP